MNPSNFTLGIGQRASLIFCCLSALLLPAIGNAQTYYVQPLTGQGGASLVFPLGGIDDSGLAGGFSYAGSGFSSGLFEDGITANVTLNGSSSFCWHVSDGGYMSGSLVLPDGVTTHAYLFTESPSLFSQGTTQDLGDLGYGFSEGLGVNALGEVVGDAQISDLPQYEGGNVHAFLSVGGHMRDIHNLVSFGGPLSEATSISDNGNIAGYSTNADYDVGFFLLSNNTLHYLGAGLGAIYPSAFVNNAGQVAFTSSDYRDEITHAFLYKGGKVTDLGTLGGNTSFAWGITEGGEVYGYSTTYGNYPVHAFLTQNGVMKDLNTLINPASYGWQEWRIIYGINKSGQIVGSGIDASGNESGFLLTPSTAATIANINSSIVEQNGVYGAVVSWDTNLGKEGYVEYGLANGTGGTASDGQFIVGGVSDEWYNARVWVHGPAGWVHSGFFTFEVPSMFGG